MAADVGQRLLGRAVERQPGLGAGVARCAGDVLGPGRCVGRIVVVALGPAAQAAVDAVAARQADEAVEPEEKPARRRATKRAMPAAEVVA